MTHPKLIEAAKAIGSVALSDVGLPPADWTKDEFSLKVARAAIQSLMEPTEDMCAIDDVVAKSDIDFSITSPARYFWQSMLNTILEGQG